MPTAGFSLDVHVDQERSLDEMVDDVREGLAASPPSIPSKYFYDERGSRLFEEITDQPEYYLTRAEMALLEAQADQILAHTAPEELIELGAGSAKKTQILIEAALHAGHLRRYLPVDVSEDMARETAARLVEKYPSLEVHAVVGDFERHLGRIPLGRRPLVALLGSTLGNFPEDEAVGLLRQLAAVAGSEGFLLLGTDLVKDVARLEAAYNDAQGVTAEFNRNILEVLNDQLGAEFDAAAFDHVSRYSRERRRIETSLKARIDQAVRVEDLDLELRLRRGDEIRTEVSCKYTRESLGGMLSRAGLQLVEWYEDAAGDYALSLSRRRR